MLELLFLLSTLLLLFILPVRSFSRDAALVFVEVELSLETLLALGSFTVVEQLVARWAHNPKVTGSSPVPATREA